jgi:hypothetical protein
MIAPAECESNPGAAADPPETQSLKPATTKEASDVLINLQVEFGEGSEHLRVTNDPAACLSSSRSSCPARAALRPLLSHRLDVDVKLRLPVKHIRLFILS